MTINATENFTYHTSNYSNPAKDTNTSSSDQTCSDFSLNFLFKTSAETSMETHQTTETLDIFGELINPTLSAFNDSIFELEDSMPLASSSQSPLLPSVKGKRKYNDQCKNDCSFLHSLQTSAKIACVEPKIKAYLVPPESKEELVYGIHRVFYRTNLSIRKIQKGYAEKLQVKPQDIAKIYKAVCSKNPTAKKASKIRVVSIPKNPRSDRVLRSTLNR